MQASGIEIPAKKKIYCNDQIIAACDEIAAGYDRTLDDVAYGLMMKDPLLDELSPDVFEYRGLLGEYRLFDMFKWLKDRNGWDIEYPIVESETERMKFYTDVGNRIKAELINGCNIKNEYDFILTLDGCWLIGESKTGRGSLRGRDALDKVNLLFDELGIYPAFVLGVPKDSKRSEPSSREHFESLGGRVVVFPETGKELKAKAREMLARRKMVA